MTDSDALKAKIHAMHSGGATNRQIADSVHVTIQYVWQELNRERANLIQKNARIRIAEKKRNGFLYNGEIRCGDLWQVGHGTVFIWDLTVPSKMVELRAYGGSHGDGNTIKRSIYIVPLDELRRQWKFVRANPQGTLLVEAIKE